MTRYRHQWRISAKPYHYSQSQTENRKANTSDGKLGLHRKIIMPEDKRLKNLLFGLHLDFIDSPAAGKSEVLLDIRIGLIEFFRTSDNQVSPCRCPLSRRYAFARL